jgi:hypothetical protein
MNVGENPLFKQPVFYSHQSKPVLQENHKKRRIHLQRY